MTCYAMDVMLNCYGGRNEPKFTHLGNLHRAIAAVAPELLAQPAPITVPLTKLNARDHQPAAVGGGAAADCSSAGILQWPAHAGACSGLTLDS